MDKKKRHQLEDIERFMKGDEDKKDKLPAAALAFSACAVFALCILIVSVFIRVYKLSNENNDVVEDTVSEINQNFDITSSGVITYDDQILEVLTMMDKDTNLEYILIREQGSSEYSITLRQAVDYDEPYIDPYQDTENE